MDKYINGPDMEPNDGNDTSAGNSFDGYEFTDLYGLGDIEVVEDKGFNDFIEEY